MAKDYPPYRTGPTSEEKEQYEELRRQWYLKEGWGEPPTGRERGRAAAEMAALTFFPYGRAYKYGKVLIKQDFLDWLHNGLPAKVVLLFQVDPIQV